MLRRKLWTRTVILTCTVIVGEALALLTGMRLLWGKNNPWISTKNDALLAADLITGPGIVTLAVRDGRERRRARFRALVIAALLTHTFREIEYYSVADNKFLDNPALFVVNNLKIAGLLVALVPPRGDVP